MQCYMLGFWNQKKRESEEFVLVFFCGKAIYLMGSHDHGI